MTDKSSPCMWGKVGYTELVKYTELDHIVIIVSMVADMLRSMLSHTSCGCVKGI